jgi:iron complex transport system permease protein
MTSADARAVAAAPPPVAGRRGKPSLGRSAAALVLAGSFLASSVLVGISVGPVHLGVGAIVEAAAAHLPFVHVHSPLSPADEAILWQLRAPRVVLGCLVGGMLAIAGASYQGVFRNPLADPYLLGIAAGAGLGATLAIVYGHGGLVSYQLLPLAAFAGAATAVAGAYTLGRAVGSGQSAAILVLAGVTVASFLTAVQTFVQQQHSDTVREVYAWILGRLDTAGWRDVGLALPYVTVSVVALLLHRRLLDVLSVGDEEAAALGVHVGRVRLSVVIFATVGTAAAVAVSGLIGFVGIIVPHAVRLLVGPSYRLLLPLSLLVGAGFLVYADILARTVMAPAEVPIGVVTAFFGAPFFAVVLRTTRMVGV